MQLKNYWLEILLLFVFVIASISYILYDPFGRQQEGFRFKKISSYLKKGTAAIQTAAIVSSNLPGVKTVVDKVSTKKKDTRKSTIYKEGVCLPKRYQLDKGISGSNSESIV